MTLTHHQTVTISPPREAFGGDQPLVAVMRGPYAGSLHRGALAVVEPTGSPHLSVGDTSEHVFLRSAAKPFQVLPAILSGAIDNFGISERELAVLCASHSAEPRHMDAVLGALAKLGLDESALHCGVHPPLHPATAAQMIRTGAEPTPVCNNCSGAHTGMLAACLAGGWPVENYGSPDHPLQELTREILAEFADIAPQEVEFGIDNCHVPAFRIPLCAAATAFARLASGYGVREDRRAAAARVVDAMTSHPEMVAGEDRFDTDLMRVAGPAVVAKGGAEAFQGVGLIHSGLGIALKVSDGNPRAVSPVMVPLLHHLGALSAAQVESLRAYAEPQVFDHQGQLVGALVPLVSFGGAA